MVPSLWIQERAVAVTLKRTESHKDSESKNCNNMRGYRAPLHTPDKDRYIISSREVLTGGWDGIEETETG